MRRTFVAVLAVVAALLLGMAPMEASATEPPSGALVGTVVDDAGRLVADADVDVLDPSTDVVLATGATDGAGRYEIGVDDGTYDVRLRMPAAGSAGVRPRQTLRTVAVSGPTTLRWVALPDPAFVRVSGVVRDAAGNGFPKAQLWFRQGFGGNVITAAPENGFDTRPPGTFDTIVPAGHYDFVLRAPRDQPTMDVAFPLELTSDLASDFTLPIHDVSVTTLAPDGTPASGVMVRPGLSPNVDVQVTPTIVGKGSFFGSGTTGPDGVGTFPAFVTSSDFAVLATPPANGLYGSTEGVLGGGASSTTVSLPATVPVHGTVRDSHGAPVAGAWVQMGPTTSIYGGPGPYGTTDAAGAYLLRAVPGAYRLTAGTSSSTPGGPSHSARDAVDVSVADDLTQDLVIPETRAVTVTVRDADGNPAASVAVSASSPPATAGPTTDGPAAFSSATTAADGTAVVYVLPGKQAAFNARPQGFGFATSATLVPSDTLDLQLPTLVPVTGTARFDGVPMPGVRVQITTGPGRTEVTTDAGGHFTMAAPAGEARIGVSRFGTGNGAPAPQPTFFVEGPVTIGAEGRHVDLDVPAAHVELRGAGMPLPSLNAGAFAMSPTSTLGFPFADGAASGYWNRYDPTSGTPAWTTTLLPSDAVTFYLNTRGVSMPVADGDHIVIARVVADDVAPTVTATQWPAPNAAGWHAGSTLVSFACTDDRDPQPSCPAPTTVANDTDGTVVTGVSTDRAGNRARTSTTVRIDTGAPTIDGSASAPEAPAWTNGDVVVHFGCGDARSGIASCADDQVVTGEGEGLLAHGTARDVAGNQADTTMAFNIDRTAPTIEVTSLAPDGWATEAVTVVFTCTDSLSGIASCPEPVTIDPDTVETVVTGEAVDRAGNRASTSMLLRVDGTAPTIVARSDSPESPAWINHDARVRFECTDSRSGVASCADDIVVTGEGEGLVARGVARDIAGNEASATMTFNIDRTAPSIEARGFDPDAWMTHPVEVSFQCTDNLSGIASCPMWFNVVDDGVHPFSATTSDVAGNVRSIDGVVRMDATGPTATPTYPSGATNGWYRGPVTVPLVCSDQWSGVASCPSHTFKNGGADQRRTLAATDRAGNLTTADVTVSIDDVAPETTIASSVVTTSGMQRVRGTATDLYSGVRRVLVTYSHVGGASFALADVTCSAMGCTWSADPPKLPGVYSVSVKAYDQAGNVDATPATATLINAL